MTKLPDINFEIDGDTVFIEQGENYGDVFRIELHRSQIGLIALQLGIVPARRSLQEGRSPGVKETQAVEPVRHDDDVECNTEPLPGSTS